MKEIYYTIGQVSALTDLPQSVLRYWETVFDELSPSKSPGGSRQYSQKDIDVITTIKSLLYEQGYTIKGAINKLKNGIPERRNDEETKGADHKNKIDSRTIAKEIKEIIRILES